MRKPSAVARAGLGNEVARDVDAADHAAGACRENREIPRAASRIEHACAGLNGLPRHEFLRDIFDGASSQVLIGLPEEAGAQLPIEGCETLS